MVKKGVATLTIAVLVVLYNMAALYLHLSRHLQVSRVLSKAPGEN